MAHPIYADKEASFEAMRRLYNQREKTKHTTIKLPCHNASIEIFKPVDQFLQCPTCLKRYFLSYSMVNSKLYGE